MPRGLLLCAGWLNYLNVEMVEAGLALDEPGWSRGMFAEEEAKAREAARGMWAGRFIPPAEWRRMQRDAAERQAGSGEF